MSASSCEAAMMRAVVPLSSSFTFGSIPAAIKPLTALTSFAVTAEKNDFALKSYPPNFKNRLAASGVGLSLRDCAQPTGDKAKATDTPRVEKIDVNPAEGGASKSPIVVVPGPGGLLIASEDPQALNQFKELLSTLQSPQIKGQRQYTVFYLRHARAAAAMGILGQVFHGTTSYAREDDVSSGKAGLRTAFLGADFFAGCALVFAQLLLSSRSACGFQ
jgi:hypothetical protein